MSNAKSIRKAYRPELVVLVVEDHLLFAKGIKHALPQHTVVFARSVEEAKQRYQECLPDITFLDIDLPDGNGFEFLDYQKSCDTEAYTVILSGSKIKEDIDMARKKGAQGYIIKPFVNSKIEHVIETYMESREKKIQSLLAETERHRNQATGSLSQPTNDD